MKTPPLWPLVTLIVSQRPHLRIPSHWGLVLQNRNLKEGHSLAQSDDGSIDKNRERMQVRREIPFSSWEWWFLEYLWRWLSLVSSFSNIWGMSHVIFLFLVCDFVFISSSSGVGSSRERWYYIGSGKGMQSYLKNQWKQRVCYLKYSAFFCFSFSRGLIVIISY